MSFTPPLYKNTGKSIEDLQTDKYGFARKLAIKSAASNGAKFDAKITASGSDFDGGLKASYKQSDAGTFEAEVDTTGTIKYSLKNDKLADGVVAKITGDETATGKVDIEYRKDFAAVATNTVASQSKASVAFSAVVGFEGLSVGGQVKYDVKAQDVADYNAVAEYTDKDFTATLKTTNKADNITASYIHEISKDFTLGAQLAYNIPTNGRTLTISSSYNVDDKTLLLTKVNNNGVLTTYYEVALQNPNVKVGLTSEYNIQKQTAHPEKYGINVTVGSN